ncbi:MAG TPA: hypothetical protein PLQ34_07690 [Ferrovaceae bacterium]|nr:hypothetical protein [Ferrovaceae bacterium]
MSELVTFNPNKVPASRANREKSTALSSALTGGSGSSGKRISIKGGVFHLLVDGKEVASIDERHLDVVIVSGSPHYNRSYYAKNYSEGAGGVPDCWSVDGTVPSPKSRNKQSEKCLNCPQNEVGSGQGESKACRFSQRIAVVLANNIEGDVMQMSIPAKSIFGKEENDNRPLQAYARWLSAQGIEPNEVVTRLRFDTKESAPKLFFKTLRWLEDSEYEAAINAGESQEAVKALEFDFPEAKDDGEPFEQGTTAPAFEGKRPARKAAPKPAPVEESATEEVVEEVAEEPPVRAPAKPKATAPISSDVASLIDEWGTDD